MFIQADTLDLGVGLLADIKLVSPMAEFFLAEVAGAAKAVFVVIALDATVGGDGGENSGELLVRENGLSGRHLQIVGISKDADGSAESFQDDFEGAIGFIAGGELEAGT